MALTQVSSSLLANTGVTAGTYGGSNTTSIITVNAEGQITSAANVATTKLLTLVQPGTISVPFTGVARCYPTSNVLIANVYASLGTTSSNTFTFMLLKNGSNVGVFNINTSTYQMPAVTTNISVNKTDYLTMNIIAGNAATDLKVDLQCTILT
jgi:hypothetical protein